MQRPPPPKPKEQHRPRNRTDQPQQHIDQIHPHRILHPLNPRIPLWILTNIHLPKDPKQRKPKHTRIPPAREKLANP